jgi:hypothetical protein
MKGIPPFVLATVFFGMLCCSNLSHAADSVSTNSISPAAVTNASPTRSKDGVEFVIGPVYVDAPELAVRPGVPQGTLHDFVS